MGSRSKVRKLSPIPTEELDSMILRDHDFDERMYKWDLQIDTLQKELESVRKRKNKCLEDLQSDEGSVQYQECLSFFDKEEREILNRIEAVNDFYQKYENYFDSGDLEDDLDCDDFDESFDYVDSYVNSEDEADKGGS
ncbi:unnamed protein product [Phytomonas sp. Hart1]|nr:unnamed protein product [Phytomonas sp. Hart1]|eukprot:CCW72202.1 unnamed protein product [Phytomonas sp. isolate Hart1]